MIGGLSWVSTAEYYRLINVITQEILGGVNSAHLILESVNRHEYVDAAIEKSDEDTACQIILSAAKALEAGGAEFIVISCNDVHRFVPDIEPHVSTPFLHIAEATAAAINKANIKTVALLGVRKTMEEAFYPDILKQHGIDTIIPNEIERKYIHDSIYNELVKNVFDEATREKYKEIVGNLQSTGAEGAILGCTEIPLLLSDEDVDISTFSTTEIHCRAAVELAVEQ